MAAPAIAAVAKKAAEVILTNPKILKKVLGIILGIILILLMPILAIIGILNGNVEIDPNLLQEHIEQQMTADDIARGVGVKIAYGKLGQMVKYLL